jgi:TolA-binding protein
MRGIPAQHGLKRGLFLAFALAAGLSLGACTDIDNMFGGGDDTEMAEPPPSAAPPDAGAPPTAGSVAGLPTTAGAAPVATITPVTIESGPDTGTAVNKTIQSLRAQVAGLQQRLAANSGRVVELRNQGAGAAGAYQEAKAHITTRLQVGTTRGNPELVAEWNTAQGQLDGLSANLNAMNGVGTDVTNDSSTAHFALDQISATFNVSGAVDEDHRQLQLLEDETSQTIVMIDRLLKEVSDSIQRQTAYIASERANLTTLAAAIKNGDFYGGSVGGGLGSGGLQTSVSGSPLVVVRFDRPNVDYQQILYAALNQALQNRPSASFQVVAVAPTRGNAASVQMAQSTARRHAEAVMRSMTDMGVPATRVGVASTTDPSATVSEVRVFIR